MTYYCITNSTSKDIGKTYPQLHCSTQHNASIISSWSFPDSSLILNFELNKSSKITDVLSDASILARGFIVNEKVKSLLSDYKLMTHRYYDVTIKSSKIDSSMKYYWLHLCQPDLVNNIDYKRSIFYETRWEVREDIIELSSYSDYELLKKNDKKAMFGVELDKIYLSDSFNRDLDLFTFLPFSNQVYISNRLSEALMKNMITGINIQLSNDIH